MGGNTLIVNIGVTCVCVCAFVCAHPGEDVLARLGGAGERERQASGWREPHH